MEWKQQSVPRNHGLVWQFTHIWDRMEVPKSIVPSTRCWWARQQQIQQRPVRYTSWWLSWRTKNLTGEGMVWSVTFFLPHLWLRLLWWLWSLLLCYYHHYQRYGYYSYGLILGIILLMIINYYHNVPIVGFMMTVMIMDMMLVIGNMMAKKHCDDW